MDKEIDFYCSYNIECIFDGSKDIPITIKKICKSKDINSKSKLCKICKDDAYAYKHKMIQYNKRVDIYAKNAA